MKNRLTQIQNCKFRDRLNHCPRQTIIFEESLSPTEYQKNNWKSSWNLQIWPTCSTIEPIHSWWRGHLVKLFVPIFLAEDEMLPICTELRTRLVSVACGDGGLFCQSCSDGTENMSLSLKFGASGTTRKATARGDNSPRLHQPSLASNYDHINM